MAQERAWREGGDDYRARFLRGDPYTGVVVARVTAPDGKVRIDKGEGRAHFAEVSSGRAKLVVVGAINDPNGDTGFTVDGRYDETGWRGGEAGVVLVMSPDGRIAGKGEVASRRLAFAGRVEPARLTLLMTMTVQQGAQGTLAPGTKVEFDYELGRSSP